MRQRQLGRPGVAAELVGGAGVVLDVDGGLLGLDEELARAADAEAVVGGLGRAADLDGVLVDDVLVGLGVALRVVDVPAEGLEEGVEELAAELGLVVVRRSGRRRGCGRSARRGRGLPWGRAWRGPVGSGEVLEKRLIGKRQFARQEAEAGRGKERGGHSSDLAARAKGLLSRKRREGDLFIRWGLRGPEVSVCGGGGIIIGIGGVFAFLVARGTKGRWRSLACCSSKWWRGSCCQWDSVAGSQ